MARTLTGTVLTTAFCTSLTFTPSLSRAEKTPPQKIKETSEATSKEEKKKQNPEELTWKAHGRNIIKQGFDRKGWWILGVGTAVTLAIIPWDKDIREDVENNNRKIGSGLSQVGSRLGGGVPLTLFALGQMYWDYPNGLAALEAMTLSSITHNILKFSTARERPDRPQRESFPSGHTAHGFAFASAMQHAYGWKAAVPSYTVATLIGLSRQADGVHWTSDLIFGAVLGIWWGRATRYDKSSGIKPYADFSSGTFGFRYEF